MVLSSNLSSEGCSSSISSKQSSLFSEASFSLMCWIVLLKGFFVSLKAWEACPNYLGPPSSKLSWLRGELPEAAVYGSCMLLWWNLNISLVMSFPTVQVWNPPDCFGVAKEFWAFGFFLFCWEAVVYLLCLRLRYLCTLAFVLSS